MPLACALTDSSAILAITANVPTSQFNRSPFQEINRHYQADFPNIMRPVVKRSFQPTRVDMLPLALRQAMTTMLSGRPGPVNLDVPFNVFQEEDDVEVPPAAPLLNAQRSGASPEEISAAIDMILAAERPVIFIGHGVTLSEAGARTDRVCARLGIPVISSPNGMGCLDMADPLSLGFIGRNGAYPANEAGRHADLVHRHRRALRRPLGVIVDAGLFVEFPAPPSSSTSMSIRPRSAATIRPTSAFSPMRAPSCASSWPSSSGARRREATLKAWHADIAQVASASGTHSPGRISTSMPRRSGPSAWSPIARRCCPTTRSSPATSA